MSQYLRTQVEHLTSLKADRGEIRERSCFDLFGKRVNETVQGQDNKRQDYLTRFLSKPA